MRDIGKNIFRERYRLIHTMRERYVNTYVERERYVKTYIERERERDCYSTVIESDNEALRKKAIYLLSE